MSRDVASFGFRECNLERWKTGWFETLAYNVTGAIGMMFLDCDSKLLVWFAQNIP